LTNQQCNARGMGTPPYYFGRRPEPPKPVVIVPQFEIQCQCGSRQVKAIAEASEDGLKLYLFCAKCRAQDELPVR
jgi:hypothetical protein